MPKIAKDFWDKFLDDFRKTGYKPQPSEVIAPHPAFTQEEINRVFDRAGLGHLKHASLGDQSYHTAWVPVLHAIMDRLDNLERGDKAD